MIRDVGVHTNGDIGFLKFSFWKTELYKQQQSFAGVLQKRCSEKPRKIYSKLHVPEPLFYAVVGSKFRTLKRDSITDVFRGFCKKN